MASNLPLICFFFFLTVVSTSVSGEEYQVGGAVGWRIPATNETELYDVWASRRQFHIGDSLRFRYENNSVTIVEKWGFYHCDPTNPIAFFNDGDTVINLDNVGTMYFISGDVDRCKQGVKMMVDVTNPVPVKYFPPAISTPPENSYPAVAPALSPENLYSGVAPSPSQIMSSGDSPDLSPGPSSDSSSSFLISVVAVIVGLGLSVLNQ